MITSNEALARILAKTKKTSVEYINLDDALGRVLAKDMAALLCNPPFAMSAMDGYGVKSDDTKNAPVKLDLIEIKAAAGCSYNELPKLKKGQAIRIFTGGIIPKGVDSVTMQEDTISHRQENKIEILKPIPLKKFIRPAGLDFDIDDVLLKKGKLLNAKDLALLASMGHFILPIYMRPKVAVLATGNEIAIAGEQLGNQQKEGGKIIGSNTVFLMASLKALGCDAINLGVAKDTKRNLKEKFKQAKNCDLLITTGGVSVGEFDLVQDVLNKLGFKLDFWRVKTQPGKPVLFGTLNNTLVLGLPGNPVSVGVGTYMYVSTLLKKLSGRTDYKLKTQKARLVNSLGSSGVREFWMRAKYTIDKNGVNQVETFDSQDSSQFSIFTQSNCLLRRPILSKPSKKGEIVDILIPPKGSMNF